MAACLEWLTYGNKSQTNGSLFEKTELCKSEKYRSAKNM